MTGEHSSATERSVLSQLATLARPIRDHRRSVRTESGKHRTADATDYYGSAESIAKYVSDAHTGLTGLERRAIDQYFTPVDGTVIDVGCGVGRTTAVLDRMGYDVTGIDLTSAFVERARQFFPDVPFVVSDAQTLPFEDATFENALFAYYGIDEITPEAGRYEVLREIRRILEPGGVFVFSSHNLWSTYVPRSLTPGGVRKYAKFWIENVRQRRIFSRYKWDNYVSSMPRPRHYIRPSDQKRQLRGCGFDVLDVVRPTGPLERFFHHPYYVARKPE